jgi:hypothetical protein
MRKYTFLAFFLLLFNFGNAQKSAPVAGDASALVDLLFKDYDAVNPDTKLEEIAKDRTKVIAIFKSYAKDYKSTSVSPYPETEKLNYQKSIEAFANFNKKTKFDIGEIGQIEKLKTNLNTDKKTFYDNLQVYDAAEINSLTTYYTTKTNKFIEKILNDFSTKYNNLKLQKSDFYAKSNANLSIQKSLPFSGGDILVDGIDGLSRFLAKRIKEELTLNAIQNIQEYLKNKEKKEFLYELEAVLPKTVDYLKSFDADEVLKFSNDIKQYIEDDFDNLLVNASKLRYTPRVMRALEKYPDLDFAFEGLEILDQVSKIKSPVDYFEIISNSRSLERWKNDASSSKKAIAQSLQLASMLAYSLTLVENGEVKFVTTDFIANYGSQKEFIYLYFGFLHQQNIKYFELKRDIGTYFTGFVDDTTKVEKGANFFNYQITPIVKNAERIHNQFIDIKKQNKNDEKLDYNKVHQLISDLLHFTEEVTVSADWLMYEFHFEIGGKKNISDRLVPYFTVSRLANDITLDLHEKRYTNAITKAIEIPLTLNTLNDKTTSTLSQIKYVSESFQNLNALSDVITINPALSNSDKLAIWTKNKTKLDILRLKFADSITNLKMLSESIESFSKSFSTTWNDSAYTANKYQLIEMVVYSKDNLLSYLKISDQKTAMIKTLEDLVKDKKISEDTKIYLTTKYKTYEEKAFRKYLLKENFEFNEENELNELFKAFIPELLSKESIKSNHQLVKFIHFVNDVAYSDSPEAYEKAIEAFVLPVGSSSLKEKAKQYYAINSFPGILGGIEKSEGLSSATFVGFTAPVGLYIQPWGSYKNKTLGLFFPIIDIAAPVRLRLDSSNDTETLPDFEFSDIFSPGAYLVFGFGKSPFALNLGFQYGPKLRDIPTADTSSFTSIDSYRIGLGITIDIPLLTLGSEYKN